MKIPLPTEAVDVEPFDTIEITAVYVGGDAFEPTALEIAENGGAFMVAGLTINGREQHRGHSIPAAAFTPNSGQATTYDRVEPHDHIVLRVTNVTAKRVRFAAQLRGVLVPISP